MSDWCSGALKGSSETFVACGVRMLCCPCAGAHSEAHEIVYEQRDELVENASFSYGSDTVIEFITDVEGHWEYFLRLAHCSKVLYWDGEERGVWGPGILRLRPNGMLVFGGDAPDKGPGDIRLVKTLLSLKRRFPQQVYFIIGNRDLMKMRFMSELQEVEPPGEVWLPPWDPKAKTFEEFIEEPRRVQAPT